MRAAALLPHSQTAKALNASAQPQVRAFVPEGWYNRAFGAAPRAATARRGGWEGAGAESGDSLLIIAPGFYNLIGYGLEVGEGSPGAARVRAERRTV